MKVWQQRLLAMFAKLGLSGKAKEGTLTADEQKQVFAEYKEIYGVDFIADKTANEDVVEEQHEAPELSAEELLELSALIGTEQKIPSNPTQAAKVAAKVAEKERKEKESAQAMVQKLSSEEEAVTAQVVTPKADGKMSPLGGAHTPTHLYGINHEMFARSKWYNQIAITRKAQSGSITADEKQAFLKDFKTFGNSVCARIEHLRSNDLMGMLNFSDMIKGQSNIDYSDLKNTAGEYIVRRTDMILAYFRTLPSVSYLFPTISNVQHKEIAPSASFGELSQGYREGRIFKGGVKFAAEIYHVMDCMFKFSFNNMIELEKQYIGYLNQEGSSVFKWSYMEWIMVHYGAILLSEQNVRRINGVYVPQQNVVSNPANFAADGILRAVERAEENFRVLPFSKFGVYNATSMLDTIEGMWDEVIEVSPTANNMKVYANARHKQWYIRQYRAKYGQDTDFTGSSAQLVDLAPTNINWVPNMPINCYKLIITVEGNMCNLEDKPGEMMAFKFTEEFETMLTMSRWKEGAHIKQAGLKYPTKQELIASNFELQFMFTNYPISPLAIDSTVDFSANNLFELKNSTPTTIAEVIKYKPDVVYKLVASGAGDTLVKGGAFDKIKSSDFVAGAAGDYIKVYAELADTTETVDGQSVTVTKPTGKFLELERQVTT